MSPRRTARRAGSLVVVGTGLALVDHMTMEAQHAIREADCVFYVVTGLPFELYIKQLNPQATSLDDCYAPGRRRYKTYEMMTDRIVNEVRAGRRVCAVFYGHPGVLAQAPHAAVAQLRREGFTATMLPGIAADACLYADLGVNPGRKGVQSFEATNFLYYRRRLDPTCDVILWQIGLIGEPDFDPAMSSKRERIQYLVDRLRRDYPANHLVTIYIARTLPIGGAYIRRVQLKNLARLRLTIPMTLFVPGLPDRRPSATVSRWLNPKA